MFILLDLRREVLINIQHFLIQRNRECTNKRPLAIQLAIKRAWLSLSLLAEQKQAEHFFIQCLIFYLLYIIASLIPCLFVFLCPRPNHRCAII